MNRRTFLQSIGAAITALQFRKPEALPLLPLKPMVSATNCSMPICDPDAINLASTRLVRYIYDSSKGYDIAIVFEEWQ